MRTIRQQVKAMQRQWQHFDVVMESQDYVSWYGTLTPLAQPHRIHIEYGLFRDPATDPMYRKFPIVRVMSPRLRPCLNAEEETPLPHVYFDHNDLPASPLCLFDPEANEWSHNDLIAKTTVFWTADWLACYEGWLATGRWYGGGRHGATTGQHE